MSARRRSLRLPFIRGQAARGDEHGGRHDDKDWGDAGGVGDGEAGMNLHHYPLNLYKNWIIEFIKGIESQEWNELL
jgi:hypothetical protein